jgi:hypothetical protein
VLASVIIYGGLFVAIALAGIVSDTVRAVALGASCSTRH